MSDFAVDPDGARIYFLVEPDARGRTLRVLTQWTSRLASVKE